MNFAKYLAVAIALTCGAPLIEADEALREKLTGMWIEFHPGDNLVYYAKDGTFKLFLKKGEIEDLHFIEGEWTLSSDGKLKLTGLLNGEVAFEKECTVSFNADELIVNYEDNEVHHRRHVGPIPERFQW